MSGHHLLLCHWVSDRALRRARWVVDKVLGSTGPKAGGRASEKEEEREEEEVADGEGLQSLVGA